MKKTIIALIALSLTLFNVRAAEAQLSLSPEILDGAWVPRGTKCADNQFTVIYFRDGRVYSGLTAKGPRMGGRYEIRGRILIDAMKTEPAFRTGSPAMVKYENMGLTERREAVRISKNRIDFNFPGNRNPAITTPSIARCPEIAGFEPWFPKQRYRGFASDRKFLPAVK